MESLTHLSNLQEVQLENPGCVVKPSRPRLSGSDRRLLLGASLRVLHDRFSHGRPIFESDLLRVASLADDAMERAA
jgi:hypothetical protein